MVETRKAQFPCQYEWQNLQAGQYAIGIEPSTNHVFGKQFAKERNELIWLDHGEERRYDDHVDRYSTMRRRSPRGGADPRFGAQPEADYPEPSGAFADRFRAVAGHRAA